MGASNFQDEAYGRSAAEAYNRAVSDALHFSGHDPYNGTISTTSGVREIRLPAGLTVDQFIELVWACDYAWDWETNRPTEPEIVWGKAPAKPPADASQWTVEAYERAKANRRAQLALRRKWQAMPASEQAYIRSIRPVKWEAAFAVRDPRKTAKTAQGHRYVFFGLAAE
jgi:hypothetical protein